MGSWACYPMPSVPRAATRARQRTTSEGGRGARAATQARKERSLRLRFSGERKEGASGCTLEPRRENYKCQKAGPKMRSQRRRCHQEGPYVTREGCVVARGYKSSTHAVPLPPPPLRRSAPTSVKKSSVVTSRANQAFLMAMLEMGISRQQARRPLIEPSTFVSAAASAHLRLLILGPVC